LIDLPDPVRDTPAPRRSAWRNLSPIWLVPVAALAAVLWIAWQSYANRGPLIEITFRNASGIAAGETTLQYRDVVVGTVEEVGFTDDLQDVVVAVRVDTQIAPYLDADAQFWVVRPEVSAQGISGLSTVLSGSYIAAAWDLEPGSPRTRFEGLERAPLAQQGLQGVRVVLRTDNGTSIASGAPVLYRGVQVGQLESPRLMEGGETILVEAFIEAPHDRLVTSATRFWDTSGFDVSFGADGLRLDVGSLASLLSGGVAFDRVFTEGEPAAPGQVFELYTNESEARRRPFRAPDAADFDLVVRFSDSATGLASGADVTYRGLRVGQVQSLRTEPVPGGDGTQLSLSAILRIDTQLMGLDPTLSDAAIEAFFSDLVADGLRAQLQSEGLLGGGLAVALVEVPDAAPAGLVPGEEERLPELPSIPREPSDLAASARGLLDNVAALPLDEVVARAIGVMSAVEDFLRQDSVRDVPVALTALLEETAALVRSEDIQALPGELRDGVQSLSQVVAQLDASGAAANLAEALDAAGAAARDVSQAISGVPALVAELEAVARSAGDLPLQDVVSRARDVLASADALIASEDAQAVPGALLDSLRSLSAVLVDVEAADTVASLTAALDAASLAARDVSSAFSGVPALVEELETLARTARDLPLADVVRRTDALLDSANALVASEETRDLPRALTSALDQVAAALAELREGGTVENLNATLASASDAADAVASAADVLPELSRRLNQLVLRAESLVEGYDADSAFNAQTLRALREISDAARAVSQLAREIERNPNSLLFGR